MKKISILFIMLMSMIGLTACVNANTNTSDTSDGNKTTIKMELDKDYDDTDPFVNERLFMCVMLTGCSNGFAQKGYNAIDKIAEREDRYAKENSVFNPIDGGYSLAAAKFDGRETLWTKAFEDNKDTEIKIKLSLSAGIEVT